MKKLICLTSLAALMSLTGCSKITGTWEASNERQPAGAGEFNLARATFNGDGTFEAEGEYNGAMQKSAGSYSFKGGELVLTPDNGRPKRTYKASFDMSGNLMVSDPASNKDVKIKMSKVGCAGDCSKKCCKKCGAGCAKDCCKTAKKCPAGCTKECCKKA